MTQSAFGDVVNLLSQEEEANLQAMRTTKSFEDVFKTDRPPTRPKSEYDKLPTTSILKKQSAISLTTLGKLTPYSTSTLKSQGNLCRASASTVIGEQVKDRIKKLNRQSRKIKELQDPKNFNLSRFRIASGQIISKGKESCNYCCFSRTEYPTYTECGTNCMSVPQPEKSCPANYTGYYDQCQEQNYSRYCYQKEPIPTKNLNICSETKSECAQNIDYCCCSFGSNESMEDDFSRATTPSTFNAPGRSKVSCFCGKNQSEMKLNGYESCASSCCSCNCDQREAADSDLNQGLAMPDDINKGDCGSYPMCNQERMQCCCVGGYPATKQNNTSESCSCSPAPSPLSCRLPPFLINGCCPAASPCCPPYSSTTSSRSNCGFPPPRMDCCNCADNCVDIESFLRKFKQGSPPSMSSPPCLGLGADNGTGSMNFNRNCCITMNNCNDGNSCYCAGYVNDVLQSHTVYSLDYQPIGCRGNNFNHFSNMCSGGGSGGQTGCCISMGGYRMGGAGMPPPKPCQSTCCCPTEQTSCGGCPSPTTHWGLCGDFCGGQSNGIYGIGDLCCNMNTQNCYPISQLSPGYCCSFPTGAGYWSPCTPKNCSPCGFPCDMGCFMPFSCGCTCEIAESPCGSGGVNGCCSKATSCNLTPCSSE